MGKQMSKAKWGGARSTRRQHSQIMSQPTVVPLPEDPPRLSLGTTESVLLTLKLQREELTVYRNRVGELLRKEEEIVKGLLRKGQMERAKLLLTKKRFQEKILQETESQLDAIFSQASNKGDLPKIRNEVDDTIARNSEALKRLHLLLSLEKTEEILKETYEGSKKQFEVDNLMQLATVKEREWLDKDVNVEIEKLVTSLAIGNASSPQSASGGNQKENDELPLSSSATNAGENPEEGINELEALADGKLKEKAVEQELEEAVIGEENEGVIVNQVKNTEEPQVPSALTDIVTDGVASVDVENSPSTLSLSKQVPITLNLQSSEIATLLPDVPNDPIDSNNDEADMAEARRAQQPERMRIAEADNV